MLNGTDSQSSEGFVPIAITALVKRVLSSMGAIDHFATIRARTNWAELSLYDGQCYECVVTLCVEVCLIF